MSVMVFLAGLNFADVITQWQQSGVFAYIIPFLLIFALVLGILTQINLFKENKAINAIIALAVALISLQFTFVTDFFSQIFPRLGIGLVILLVAIILLGLFAPNRTWVTYSLFAIAAIIFVVVIGNTAGSSQLFSSGFLSKVDWQAWLPWIILVVLVAVVVASTIPQKPKQDVSSKFMQTLFGGEGKH